MRGLKRGENKEPNKEDDRIPESRGAKRFREEVFADVEGWRRSSRQGPWGARVLISVWMIAPSLDMLSDLRVNQWIAHLPEDHPLAQQYTSLLQATDWITWTSAHSRQLAVSNGPRILLVRGYDSLHHIKDDDLKLLLAGFPIVNYRWVARYPLTTRTFSGL